MLEPEKPGGGGNTNPPTPMKDDKKAGLTPMDTESGTKPDKDDKK